VLFFVAPGQLFSWSAQLGPLAPFRLGVVAIAVGIWTWSFVELAFLRGTVGPNRYGEDPLGPSRAEVFE